MALLRGRRRDLGTVSYLTDSILPAVVLHTGGNVYSNLDLWLHGQAEWQAPAGEKLLVWTTGPDRAFWLEGAAFVILMAMMLIAYRTLAQWPATIRRVRRSRRA